MPASLYDLSIEQGATWVLSLVWRDSDEEPIDLTGYSARMQVRPSVGSDEVLLNLSTEGGQITLGGAAGTIVIEVDAETTAAVQGRRGAYDLELESSDGTVTRLLRGSVAISPEVTRPEA